MYYIIAAILGEVIICFCGYELHPLLGTPTTILNGVMVSIVWLGMFTPGVVRIIDKDDPAESWVGTLGITLWGFSSLCFFVVAAFLACNIYPLASGHDIVAFKYQVIIYVAVLTLFFLLCGLSDTAGKQVKEVYVKEQTMLHGKDVMRRSMQSVMTEVQLLSDIPADIVRQISDVQEAVRFITPNSCSEAVELEEAFAATAANLKNAIRVGYNMNVDRVNENIKKLNVILANRKNVRN